MSKITDTEQKKIRKAYFTGTLDKYLDTLQASEAVDSEYVASLEEYLERLQAEKEKVRDQLGKKFNVTADAEIKPPSVDELRGEINQEELEAWHNKVKNHIDRAREIMKYVSEQSRKRAVDIEILKDLLLEISALRNSIDQDRVYKDQLYRARLTEIIDKHEISRKEAEERAKLTKEYRDYKLAVLFTDTVVEFINTSKKKIGHQY